jgi:phosphatidylserine/phosphatidylglycerophosphate/cardiolipin synthase-like enzyme
MKPKWFRLVVCLSFVLAAICSTAYAADLVLNNVPVDVYFSPNGGCTKAIIHKLNNAKTEILVQAYSFTSRPIANALSEAQKRGVKVEIILDRKSANHSSFTFLVLAFSGIPIFVDEADTTAHNKVMIVDGQTVITGSFHFANQAEQNNAENLLIIKSGELAKLYADNWNAHRQHLKPLDPWGH